MRSFVVATVCVMLAAGCVPKAKYDDLETQLKQCENKLDRRGAGEGKAHKELMDQLQPLVRSGVLEVEDEGGRTSIAMRSEVLFPSGSAQLSTDGKRTISEVGRVLASRTDLDWQIEGHTDNEPISTDEFPDNWQLGAARAMSVLRVMVQAGMSAERVSAATFGQYQPVVPNTSEGNKAQNRRIEIVLLPEIRAKKLK